MQVFKKVIFVIVYTLVYIFLALDKLGTELKGPLVFLAPLATWLLLIIAVFTLSRNMSTFRWIFVATLLVMHLFVTIVLVVDCFMQEGEKIVYLWNRAPEGVIITVVWYMLGQVAIWLILFKFKRASDV